MNWLVDGTFLTPVSDLTSSVNILPKGIYQPVVDLSGWHLQRTGDSFTLPEKIYDLQVDFMDHVMVSFNLLKERNMGILLNGLKGTGKTITAQILANRMNLPVVIVKGMGSSNDAMFDFLSGINSDCIFFFDEYEKNFSKDDGSVLPFLDGIKTNNYRRICILTTNSKTVNENLIGRTSRVRYVRDFSSLSKKACLEFINDTLIDKSHTEDVLNFLEELKFVSIDILKSLITEINIHGFEKFVTFRSFFNVEYATTHFDVEYAYIHYIELGEYTEKAAGRDFAEILIEDFKRKKEHFISKYPDPGLSDEEREKFKENEARRRAKFMEEHRLFFEDFGTDYFVSSCKFKNLHVGDIVRDDEIVTHIDREKNVFFTRDDRYIYFYHLKEHDSKGLKSFTIPDFGPFAF